MLGGLFFSLFFVFLFFVFDLNHAYDTKRYIVNASVFDSPLAS